MKITSELYQTAERTMHAAGLKPKDVTAILGRLETEFNVSAIASGGLLCLNQGEQSMNVGQVLQAYSSKYPRDFYGAAGDVRFKSDLMGDTVAKMRFISEHGFDAWDSLPFNENSPKAHTVVGGVIPHVGMKRAEYLQLSRSERIELIREIGASGIERIMARV
jgi:hypothetical protein